MNKDTIYRQAAIAIIRNSSMNCDVLEENWALQNEIRQLPSAQPEIIYCRECKFASGDSRICMKSGYSPIGELDFCAWAERRTDGVDS